MTIVTSSSLAGAEMMTFLAPPSMWRLGLGGVGEEAGRLDDDVDAEVAPGQLRRVALGEGTIFLPPTMIASSVAFTSAARRPRMLSYLSRCANVALSVRSLTATISIVARREARRSYGRSAEPLMHHTNSYGRSGRTR